MSNPNQNIDPDITETEADQSLLSTTTESTTRKSEQGSRVKIQDSCLGRIWRNTLELERFLKKKSGAKRPKENSEINPL